MFQIFISYSCIRLSIRPFDVCCVFSLFICCVYLYSLFHLHLLFVEQKNTPQMNILHMYVYAHINEKMIALNKFSVETANKTNRVSEHASIWCTVWRLYVCVFKSLKKSPLHFVYCINIYIVHKTQQAHRAMGIKILCVGEKKSIQLYLVLPNTKSKTHAHSIPLFSDAL